MKPDSFTFDRRLYDLLQQEGFERFTTREMRDAYAKHLDGVTYRLGDLRVYVYEQIRRMLRAGWVVPAAERRKRGQVYCQQAALKNLKLDLVDNAFESSLDMLSRPAQKQIKPAQVLSSTTRELDATQHLESQLKEIRLDFLSSMGEAERYKQLLEEMPDLKDRVEGEYQEARDRSSRLLGHLRAVEKTLAALASTR